MNFLFPALALAQATCKINGQEVPCDQMPSWFNAIFGLGLGLIVVFFVVFIVALIFWIKMLVHAIKNNFENKPLWIIILLLFGIIGAIVYYFAVKKKMAAAVPPTPTAQ